MRFRTTNDSKYSQLMKNKGFETVEHLAIDHVATAFNTMVLYHDFPSHATYDHDFAIIRLKQNPVPTMRKEFFHELAHVIAHYGDQNQLPQEFNSLQERQAYWISLYLAMPRHIFEPLAFKHQCIATLAELFELPEEMINERVKTIQREQCRTNQQIQLHEQESKFRTKSLQPKRIYPSTYDVLKQLESQVGEENINYEVSRLLRGH
ncbi:ImmA/IrrE family metallo-endopeptidase [Halalkalibacterium halodurans]|uniref:ImmA/IrrE family metallo-endopeptidase n=1 Tax=Halalkalibacterium halodurans TaxID=86665 RepID=UPI002E218AE2|nr:ImmA/IrrE family metallo-endopeptidase [Halalkalibacterium halodurans]